MKVQNRSRVVTETDRSREQGNMKTHSHTSLFALAAWLVVGCGSNLNIGDPEPTPAPTGTTASPDPAPAPTSSSPVPPPSSSLMPCPTGTLCWANTESTRNNLVSAWDVAGTVWSVTRHGEILHWDGVSQTLRFRVDGAFDDALVWGTAADNVYAFFHRAKTPAEPFGATTVVRLHDGAFQVHASSGAYAIGALRTVQVPKPGIVAVLSKANDPASVALVDADLKPQIVLPALPIASELAAMVDETFDATASVNAVNVLSVWVLTKTGRVFRWTEGGAAWDEIRPFLPKSDDPAEVVRGTGMAPKHGENGNGVQVIRDTFGISRFREVATLEGGAASAAILPDPDSSYYANDILPHGRSVSYNPRPGDRYWDPPFVDAGQWCTISCGPWKNVDSQVNGVWSRVVLPMDHRLIVGAGGDFRYATGVGGQVYTQLRSSGIPGSVTGFVRRTGLSASAEVTAIDALSEDDVWALESNYDFSGGGSPYHARHYDGRGWSQGFSAPGPAMVASKDSVWFASRPGSGGVVSRWKAGQWTTFNLGTNGVELWKDGAGTLWAVGINAETNPASRRIHRWDGTAWSDLGNPFSSDASLSLVPSGGVVWGTGLSGKIYRREGARTDEIVCPGRSDTYYSVTPVGNEAWAVDGGRNRLLHISGTTCTELEGVRVGVASIVGLHSSDVWIAGYSLLESQPRLFHWNGRSLEPAKLAVDPVFTSASVSPLGTLWVGAKHGAILRSAVPKPN